MEELLSVLDFARIVGTTPSTLRYYDEMGVFVPKSRGNNNNYRYYSMQQLTLYNFVRVLTELKIPLKTIADYQTERSPDSMMELFVNQESIIDDEIRRLQSLRSVLETVTMFIREGQAVDESRVTVERMSALPLVYGNQNRFNGPGFYSAFTEFCLNAKNLGINLSYPVGGYFESFERFTKAPSRPNMFITIDPNGGGEKPEGLYIVAYTRGYYGDIGDSAQRVYDFAKRNNLEFCGPVFNIYLLDELTIQHTDSYLVQISASVQKNKK